MPASTKPTTTSTRSEAREIARLLSDLLTKFLAGQIPSDRVGPRLRLLADKVERVTEPKVSRHVDPREVEIFEFWRREMGKHQAKFTPERRVKVRARLADGYSPEAIKRAIRNVRGSSFHSGENEQGQEYNDLTLICRTGAKLEQFRDMGGREFASSADSGNQVAELAREAEQQLRAGDTSGYERTQAKIRTLQGTVKALPGRKT